MKSALKIIGSALLAPVVMLLILAITGVLEIIFQSDLPAWLLEIVICIAAIPLLLLFERKMKLGDLALACNGAYFISAVLFGWLALPFIIESYTTNYYDLMNPWDNSTFLKGLQWVLYMLTVYAQFGLHLIIRIILPKIKAEREAADKEKCEQ